MSDIETSEENLKEHEGEIQEDAGQEEKGLPSNIDKILGMKVPVIVKVAEKKMSLSRVLKLSLGSVIQFDKDAYQQIELMVNNSTIGLGQPVKVGENFGLRIMQIGDIRQTIKSLGGEEAG